MTTMMMPMGSERALGRGYDKKFKIPRPALMFHTTSDKKKATQNGYRKPEMSMGVEEDIATAKAWLRSQNKTSKTISVDDLNFNEIALTTSETKADIAISKARAVQTSIITTKKSKSIKVIDVYDTLMVVTDRPLGKSTVKKCQAITMANKPCPFKSTCGNFCRKHQIKK
jgi:hypothetical protein